MADLEHITAEGETYDISDATARAHNNEQDELISSNATDISALQTENAELKAQIAEMEEEISELNSDLTSVDISSYITMDSTYGCTVSYAYCKAGIVFLKVQGQITVSGESIYVGNISSPYRPKSDTMGFFMTLTGADMTSNSMVDIRVLTGGNINVRVSSAMNGTGYFTFCYPI